MSDLKATIVATLLDSRGFGQDDEVPADMQAQIVTDADAIVAALPEDTGFDFIQVFESWGTREANLTGVLLDLAIAATALVVGGTTELGDEFDVTITTAKLRTVSEDYTIERKETPGGWHLKVRRIEK